eukprot:NODE_56_length_3662_cov_41.691938_g52_i0.p1 GENE.NODE_56_length_3662_cov_41.691938_g52_i0~~NODE_56_length_3662_cov_41.691938_g52_i0.p1  ORF type:complete len:1182 (-),score=310.05 NODE_56_length_3662_cov_41.691938_g52_i0:115-3618(-)
MVATPEVQSQDASLPQPTPEAVTASDVVAVTPEAKAAEQVFAITVECATGTRFPMQVGPQETVLEVRQLLLESSECCYITNYNLFLSQAGKKEGPQLGTYNALQDIPGVQDHSVFRMKSAKYDDKAVQFHVQRLYELVNAPLSAINLNSPALTFSSVKHPSYPSFGQACNASQGTQPESNPNDIFMDVNYILDAGNDLKPFLDRFSTTSPPEVKTTGRKKGKKHNQVAVPTGPTVPSTDLDASLFDLDSDPHQYLKAALCASNEACTLPRPYKMLIYSGWSPVSAQRRLFGDLHYLEVEFLDGTHHYITASVDGFFVNQTTSQDVLKPNRKDKCQVFETLMGLLCHLDSEFAAGMAFILKARSMLHLFEATPVRVPPLKWLALEPKAPLYDYSQTQYSAASVLQNPELCSPNRDWNEEWQACRSMPCNSLDDVLIRDRTLAKIHGDFVEAAVAGALAIVNGQMVCVNPIDTELNRVYMKNNIFFSYAVDSRDQLKDKGGDKAAHTYAKQDLHGLQRVMATNSLSISIIDTAVIDLKGRRIVAQAVLPGILQGDQDSKHQYGTLDDSRDVKCNPDFHKDLLALGEALFFRPHKVQNQDGTVHEMALPVDCKGLQGGDDRRYILELVHFTPRDPNYEDRPTACLRLELLDKVARIQRSREDLKELFKARDANEPDGKKGEGDDIVEQLVELDTIVYNPDLMVHGSCVDDDAVQAQDLKNVQLVARFLTEKVLHQLLADVSSLDVTIIDTCSLTRALHEYGINMRYCGALAKLCTEKEHQFLKLLLIQEMIARVCKNDLRGLLIQPEPAPQSLSNYFNCLFGTASGDSTAESKAIKKKAALGGTSAHLWKTIRQKVLAAYAFELPELEWTSSLQMALLRAICLKIGLKIRARTYDFNTPQPLDPEDIVEFCPIVHQISLQSAIPQKLLSDGIFSAQMGQLSKAYGELTDACSLYHQMFGPMNKEFVSCFTQLGNIMFYSKYMKEALVQYHKALLISRRLFGIDNALTAQIHQFIGLICNTMGNPRVALHHFFRAHHIIKLTSGVDHPEACICLANVGMMYQELGEHSTAVKYLKAALENNAKLADPSNSQFVACRHALGVSLSQLGHFKEALAQQKKVYQLYESQGKSEAAISEAKEWYETLVSFAVQAKRSAIPTPPKVSALVSKRGLK